MIQERNSFLASALRRLLIPRECNDISMTAWRLKSMRIITFGASFNNQISIISWPAFLEQLVLGRDIDQTFQGVE